MSCHTVNGRYITKAMKMITITIMITTSSTFLVFQELRGNMMIITMIILFVLTCFPSYNMWIVEAAKTPMGLPIPPVAKRLPHSSKYMFKYIYKHTYKSVDKYIYKSVYKYMYKHT